MQQAIVSTDHCTGHDKCMARKACPTKALIQIDPGEVISVNGGLCRGCGDCVQACPERAIRMKQL